MGTVYNSKVDWWVYAVVVFTVGCCLIGPSFDGDWLLGIILSILMAALEVLCFASVKYQICDDKLGVRYFFKWNWFPIDKIGSVKKTRSLISSAALSIDRVAIKFTDKSVFKSSMPLEISPKNRDAFIAHLKEINNSIIIN